MDADLAAWLGGAEVVVTGQQPGLLGGPALTLVKACAVAAEVARRRSAGRPAVGFLWLATADDDLPEMRWARLPAGEELLVAREEGWERGDALGGLAVLGDACAELLGSLGGGASGELAGPAVELARACFAPGTTLGEACGRFLGRLMSGLGVVLVDALEPELARAGAASGAARPESAPCRHRRAPRAGGGLCREGLERAHPGRTPPVAGVPAGG